MLHDTNANDTAKKLIGNPGAFHAAYESYITGVLDAHAAVGSRCIIDNHNYCRYQDFRFQADGSVPGLTPAPQPLMRPYTTDVSQVQIRIFRWPKAPRSDNRISLISGAAPPCAGKTIPVLVATA